MRFFVILLAFLLSACAVQQTHTAPAGGTPEQFACADPENRIEKGGWDKCTAFYSGYRSAQNDPCDSMNTFDCTKHLLGLESAGFTPAPNRVGQLCTDEEIAAYRAETGTQLNDAALRGPNCP